MKKRSEVGSRDPEKKKLVEIETADMINEQRIVAAALVDAATRKKLLPLAQPDTFQVKEHQGIWTVLTDLDRKKLPFDIATATRLGSGRFTDEYIRTLTGNYPDVPSDVITLVRNLYFDKARQRAVQGPLSMLIDALKNPTTPPDRVKAIAHALGTIFDEAGERQYLHDADVLVDDQMAEIESRIAGYAVYPYGIKGFDIDLETGERRVIPGAMPGQMTAMTAMTSTGKTTVLARIILAQARAKRRVLVGAWEVRAGLTLELLTVMSLGWKRSDLLDPRTHVVDGVRAGVFLTKQRLEEFRERMKLISKSIVFMKLPFNRRGDRTDNDERLDIVHAYLADTGADVAIFDLWKRCLRDTRPEEEEHALYRQQAMADELKCHVILAHQQLMKGEHVRPDKKPALDAMKGSTSWGEVPDTIIGLYRLGMWKQVDDTTMEVIILKQRHGKAAPISVEFGWDGDSGTLAGGRTVPYEAMNDGGGSEVDGHVGGKRGGNRFGGDK